MSKSGFEDEVLIKLIVGVVTVPGKDVLQYYWRPISAINLNCNTNLFFENLIIIIVTVTKKAIQYI
jgi:hypothetical protein